MERRDFLKLTFGFVAGASALAASAQAAPFPPMPVGKDLAPPRGEGAEPAVVSQDEVDKLAPEQVRWRRRWRRRRFWGYRRRHWGWRHRWHRRRFWRRRYW